MPILTAVCLLTALLDAGTGGVDVTPPVFLDRPVFVLGPNPSTPLAGELTVHTNEPVRVEVFANDGTRTWLVLATHTTATQQDLALAGFHPSRAHTLHVSVIDRAGNRTTYPFAITFTTPRLPANFPPLHVLLNDPLHVEPGYTLTGLHYSSPTLPDTGVFLVFLDAAGEVVWYYQSTDDIGYSAIKMRNGHVLMIAGRKLAREIDLLGNTITQWWASRLGLTGMPAGAIPVDCDSFHHELHELPVGDTADFVTLSTEFRTYPNYPTNEVDTTQTQPIGNVVGDEIVEFRQDGTVVRRKSLLDVLDPYRICYDSLAAVDNDLYGVSGGDWSHANAVDIDPSDGNWLVSVRNQDAVVKMVRGTGALQWILGPHERWNPPWSQYLLTSLGSPFAWQYHQHSAKFTTTGAVLMFDNGNYRATPPTPGMPIDQNYSRAVGFRVNPSGLTVRQSWQYDGNGTAFFSRFFGDADLLPITGNISVTDGWRHSPTSNLTYARIAEVTNAAPSVAVREVIVNDPATSSNPYNWTIYRSEHYPWIE